MAKTKNKTQGRKIAVITLSVIAAVIGLSVLYKYVASGAGNVVSRFFRPYQELVNTGNVVLSDRTLLLHDRITLAKEIETLRRHNAMLETRSGIAMALMKENQRLRAHLGLPVLPNWHYVHAEVLLRDPYSWQNFFTIDRGSDHGVVSGNAVVESRIPGVCNLVGIVGKVEPGRSQVLPLGNPALRLSARIGDSEVVGFLNTSDRSARLREIPIGLLPRDFVCRPGVAVVTTGYERNIPGNLKIGEMAAMDSNVEFFSGDTQKSGFINLTTDYNALRYLIVITGKKGAAGSK